MKKQEVGVESKSDLAPLYFDRDWMRECLNLKGQIVSISGRVLLR